MNTNEQVIHTFYSAFQSKDYKTMQQCYADDATFSDPVFTNLDANAVRAMWEMFCLRSKSLDIQFKNVSAGDTKGSATWIATYVFSATGNKVVNTITANFAFLDGKITTHKDNFSFYNWAKQAMGLPGIILGWTPLVKSKVRKMANKSLMDFISRKI